MAMNSSSFRQELFPTQFNREELRSDLEKEWDKLPKGKSPVTASPKSPTKFNLDMNAVRAAQQIITQQMGMQTVSQTTSSTTTTTTTTSWITPRKDTDQEKNTPREKNLRKRNSDSEEISVEKSSNSASNSARNSARSYRDSPRKNEAYPPSSRVRSPSAVKKENSAASQKSSPATTPRDETGAEESKSPRSPRGTMRELRKKVSRKFSDMDFSKITSPMKEAASSMKSALSPSSTPRQQSPRIAKEEILATIPITDRNRMARKILELRQSEGFSKQPLHIQTMLMHGTLLQELAEDSPLRTSEGLKVLLEDVNLRNQHHRVDLVVDLEDPDFSKFVISAADGAFIKPWNKDSSDVDAALHKYLNTVKKSFARDFSHSTYQVREADGSLRALTSIDEFIAYVDDDSNHDLAMIVSNITSQNLGNFFKNSLFLRQDANLVSHSLLKLYDGTPLMPQAIAKASYILNKQKDGSLVVSYTWESSKATNNGNPIRGKEPVAGGQIFEMDDASLKITANITIQPDGNWEIGNPRVQAQGWNQTPDR